MLDSKSHLVSHTHIGPDRVSKAEITQELHEIKNRLIMQFKSDELKMLLGFLDDLVEFELGRFLIKNKSLSGYWTWYIISGLNRHSVTSTIEKFILEKSPAMLATRERFNIFQQLMAKHILSNSLVCSVPCGVMADLLTLKIPETIHGVRFVGIDMDEEVFTQAKQLNHQVKNRFNCDFIVKDAWQLGEENQYDIITSNGLNIYEKENDKVIALYRAFYHALKNKGKLICSALTHPPGDSEISEWDLNVINQEDLKMHAIIFKTILQVTWANFRTSERTCSQLKAAGFEDIEIHWDTQRIFPSFCATKK